MNKNLLIQVCMLFWLLAVPILMHGQQAINRIELETYVNQPVEHLTTSYPPEILIDNSESAPGKAENGLAYYVPVSGLDFKVIYEPNEGFIGVDSFDIIRFPYPTFPQSERFIVTVKQSEIEAVQDIVTTDINTPVLVNVLLNDITSHGNLTIENITYIESGEALLDEGRSSVQFIPEADFTGISFFKYQVCDEFGSCDIGTVSVNITSDEGPTDETKTIFTKRNEAQVLVEAPGLNLAAAPTNGTYNAIDFTYTPAQDFVGSDELTLSNGSHTLTVQIHVLDYQTSTLAFNDKVYTTPYSPVEFNVLDNDESNSCFTVTSQPTNGNLIENTFPLGSLTYIPNENFVGVDEFTYSVKAPGCGGDAETAVVQVYVSNFEPSASKYLMVTPKQTPLIIGYNIPIPDYAFEIKDQGDFGQAFFLAGAVDTVIYGQEIKGNNIILYVPDAEVISAQDAFEIEYCTSFSGVCRYASTIKVEVNILDIQSTNPEEPFCIDDCVWPGDTNLDGVVNVKDVLPLGLRMGESGELRTEATLDIWYGQFGKDWNETLSKQATVDLKHLDTDGDSFVSPFDTVAISKFYGRTHDITPVQLPILKHHIRLKGEITANPGDVIELEMFMGDEADPAIDIYGFTFPFEYNPTFFVPGSIAIEFDKGSWLSYNSPILKLSRNNFSGLVESAFTRTTAISASGFGKIGTTRIVIENDIIGFRPDQKEIEIPIGGGIATVSNSGGETFGAIIEPAMVKIKLAKESSLEQPLTADLMKVYPNPARNLMNVHLNGQKEFKRIVIHNLAGQPVFDTGTIQNNHAQIDVRNFIGGLYFVTAYTEEGVLNKKFEVIQE